MASSFSFAYKDPFHSVFVGSTTTISFLSNGLLLFIIRTTPAAHLGAYRTLLEIFAICDIITSLGHAVVQPIMHLTSTGFYGFPRHAGKMMIFGESPDTILCMMFIATFYQTFLILAYHYVYRYKTVTGMLQSSYTDRWKIKQWSLLGISVYILYIATFLIVNVLAFIPKEWTRANAPPELLEIYGMDLSNPNAGFECIVTRRRCSDTAQDLCWHWPTMAAVVGLMSLFGATGAVIVYCFYETRAAIKSTNSVMSPKTRRMQRNLFNALLIQTAIPCLFSYLPLSFFMLFPIFTGIALGDRGNFLFSITAIFPAIDSFFVLYFINRFRLAVIRLFRLPFGASEVDGSSTDHERKDSRTITGNAFQYSNT